MYTGTENIERSGKTLSFRVIFENYLVTYESKTNWKKKYSLVAVKKDQGYQNFNRHNHNVKTTGKAFKIAQRWSEWVFKRQHSYFPKMTTGGQHGGRYSREHQADRFIQQQCSSVPWEADCVFLCQCILAHYFCIQTAK